MAPITHISTDVVTAVAVTTETTYTPINSVGGILDFEDYATHSLTPMGYVQGSIVPQTSITLIGTAE